MKYKGHKLLIPIILLCLFILLGFTSSGIFVKEYKSIGTDGKESIFIKEEKVQVLKESEKSFIIVKDESIHEIPKTNLIRTTRSTQNYKVKFNTPIYDKPKGIGIRLLFEGEELILQKIEDDYGLFQTTTDNISGYVELENLQVVLQESLTYGISKVNKVLNNDNNYYVLTKGEFVAIKNFKENKYIIIDNLGREFQADESFIEIKASINQVSRSSISRRTQSLTKVITSAYEAIGSPYVYADTGKRGYDCSGLTYSIFLKDLEIKLPRSSSDQVNAGYKVDKSELAPGDILFFNTSGKGISHVGIYVDDGNMIHASSGKRQVRIDNINSGYYSKRYVTARRIIE